MQEQLSEILRKVRKIELITRGIVREAVGGEYHSVFKGQGIDFDDFREYQPGDEVRSIDWNVTARMGFPYIKKFIEEREMTVFLAVDISGSQGYGGENKSKRELAAEIATFGTFNFLLSNGEFMFAHCTTNLHFVTRRYPFTTVKLVDCDMQIDLSKHNSVHDVISVIATQPLTTNEQWQAFMPGELRVFVDGRSVDVTENPVTL